MVSRTGVVHLQVPSSATRVRVAAGGAPQQLHSRKRHPDGARPRCAFDGGTDKRVRNDDQIALSLETIGHRDGHLPVQVVEDVQTAEGREVGQGEIGMHGTTSGEFRFGERVVHSRYR